MASLLFNPRQKRHRDSRRRRAIESIEKGLCRFEVGRVEPFGKPVEDRLEDRHRIRGTALIALLRLLMWEPPASVAAITKASWVCQP